MRGDAMPAVRSAALSAMKSDGAVADPAAERAVTSGDAVPEEPRRSCARQPATAPPSQFAIEHPATVALPRARQAARRLLPGVLSWTRRVGDAERGRFRARWPARPENWRGNAYALVPSSRSIERPRRSDCRNARISGFAIRLSAQIQRDDTNGHKSGARAKARLAQEKGLASASPLNWRTARIGDQMDVSLPLLR
jgi:hypothetical protein